MRARALAAAAAAAAALTTPTVRARSCGCRRTLHALETQFDPAVLARLIRRDTDAEGNILHNGVP